MLTNSEIPQTVQASLPTSSISLSDPKAKLLAPPTQSKGSIIRANNSSFLSRIITIGASIGGIYTFSSVAWPLVIPIIGFMGCYFFREIKTGMSPQKSEKLRLAMSGKVPGQPSIDDLIRGSEDLPKLKYMYPVDAVNRAIEEIWPYCRWVKFLPGDPHPLAVFQEEIYCYVDPRDHYNVMTPVEALAAKLSMWGVKELPPPPPKKKRGSRAVLDAIDVPSENVTEPRRSFRIPGFSSSQPSPTPSSPQEGVAQYEVLDPFSPTVIVGSDTKLKAVEVKAEAVDHFPNWKPEEMAEETILADRNLATLPIDPWSTPKPINPEKVKSENFMRQLESKVPPIPVLGGTTKGWTVDRLVQLFPSKTSEMWCTALKKVANSTPETYSWNESAKTLVKK